MNFKKWMLEQPGKSHGCSSIWFLPGEFYEFFLGQKFKKSFIKLFWGQESSISWNIRIFFRGGFFNFFDLGLKSGPSSSIMHYFCWQVNVQLWEWVLAVPSFVINITYEDLAVVKWNSECNRIFIKTPDTLNPKVYC